MAWTSQRPHLVPTAFVPRESCGCTAAATLNESGEAASRRTGRCETACCTGSSGFSSRGGHDRPGGVRLERAVNAIERGLDVGAGAREPMLADLAEAAAALHSVNPRWTTISAVVACLEQYQRDLGRRVARGQSAARFQAGITAMAVELSRCVTQAAATATTGLNEAMTLDHELSVSS